MIRKLLFASILLFAALAMPRASNAQLTAPPGGAQGVGAQALVRPDKLLTGASTEATVYDGSVDPYEYHLGPGDVLQLRLWTLEETLPLTVSPERVLMVPRVGEFDVSNKTLGQLRDSVYARAALIFRSVGDHSRPQEKPLTLSLYQPRKILVKVKGQVLNPSLYAMTGANRATLAIELANRPQQEMMTPEQKMEQTRKREESDRMSRYFGSSDGTNASQRYISVAHGDGTIDRLDIIRYNATHDNRWAPLVREGDIVYVPARDPGLGSVSVYGGVQSPGDFEFVPGDSLYVMILAALGPTPFADLSSVELTRANGATGEFSTRTYDAAAIRDHRVADVPLMTGDRIIVRSSLQRNEVARVAVTGEISRPGVYPVIKGKTKLTEVLKSAGGFTKEGYPLGVMMLRKWVSPLGTSTAEDELQMSRVANLSMYDTAVFKQQFYSRMPFVTIDCDRLFGKGDSSADVYVEDQDMVIVPKTPNSVYVHGYVASAGFVTYQKGADVKYYIGASGGFVDGAVKSHTRVIKSRTKSWVDPSETTIEAGDEIYVPKETEYPVGTTLQTIAALAGILGGLSIAFSILYDRFKKTP